MSKVDPRQRITRVVEGWFLSEPLLFAAWTMHETVARPQIATIRVGRGKIEFNPEFIASLNNDRLRDVLGFETMRILLGHPYSRRQANAELSYAASNLSVQECMRTDLPIPRPREVLGGIEHDHQYFEYYYRALFERQRDEPKDRSNSSDDDEGTNQDDETGGHDCDAGQPDAGASDTGTPGFNEPNEKQAGEEQAGEEDAGEAETGEEETGSESSGDESNSGGDMVPPTQDLDSYCDPESVGLENTQSWDSDDLIQEELSIAIQEAAQGDGWGTLGGFAKEQLKATLKPPMDYRGVLRQFRQSVLSVNRRLTRMKASRRYGFDQMGSRYDFTTSLLFAVDVSGSMCREDLEQGFSVVNRFFQYGVRSIDVVSFDTQISEPPTTLRRAKHSIEVTGRGGTDFQCVIDFVDGRSAWKSSSSYNGLIIFTDGLAPVPTPPKNRGTKVLWLFHTEEAFRRSGESLQKLGPATFLRSSVSRVDSFPLNHSRSEPRSTI